jgi:beta-1,4-mannosyltransferase
MGDDKYRQTWMRSAAPLASERRSLAPPIPSPARVRRRPGLASFPGVLPTNPYQRLLYGELRRFGFRVANDVRFDLGWLRRARGQVGFLHFHWPQSFWRHEDGPEFLRPSLSYVKLGLFGCRLGFARVFGYRIAWTIHQVYPHEVSSQRLDRLGAKILARLSHVRLAHDLWTAQQAHIELGEEIGEIDVVPHGSYVGTYPPGRPRDVVRAELGIPANAFVFLCFGDLRAYKEVETLLDAFGKTRLPDAVLVIAGAVRNQEQGAAVRVAADRDPRIKPLLGFTPQERVAELFGSADAAVVVRGDGGTSGSLILALSLGTPVVAAQRPAYDDLLRDGAGGWLFEAGSVDSLTGTLETAARTDAEIRREKAHTALDVAEGLRWPEIAEKTATLLLGANADRACRP